MFVCMQGEHPIIRQAGGITRFVAKGLERFSIIALEPGFHSQPPEPQVVLGRCVQPGGHKSGGAVQVPETKGIGQTKRLGFRQCCRKEEEDTQQGYAGVGWHFTAIGFKVAIKISICWKAGSVKRYFFSNDRWQKRKIVLGIVRKELCMGLCKKDSAAFGRQMTNDGLRPFYPPQYIIYCLISLYTYLPFSVRA